MIKDKELIQKKILKDMTLEEKCYLLSGKDFWQTRSIKQLKIPNMTMADGPHGVRKQEGKGDQLGLNKSVPATCFPTAATIANSWNTELGEEIGKCLGEEAACQNVNVLLGPGMNIKRSPLCGRNFEYFSEDPYLSGKMAAAYIRGIQSYGVAACPKHFAVNSQELRRMASDSVLDERTLREIYLTAFEIAVKEAGPQSIMTSYNRVNGTYASENSHLLLDILKEEWGFDGCVITDWGGSNDHVAGVLAGIHLEMPTTGGDSDLELLEAVKSGRVPEKWLDKMVDELLKVIISTTDAVEKKKGSDFDVDLHHQTARRAMEESIVLLKNEDNILPLAGQTKVALIGDFADTPRYQGSGSSIVNPTKLDSMKEEISHWELDCVGFAKGYLRVGGPNEKLEQEACQIAGMADVVLLCIGLDEMSEAKGLDREHMRIPANQIALLEKLQKVNDKIVVVFSGGSAVEMPWLTKCKALVHGYLCGQAGPEAVMKVLTGEVNPSGKLAETYPLRYEDVPSRPYYPGKERTVEYRESLYVGYRYFETADVPVLFPFGFGLSYTSFAYSNLSVTEKEASFTITNTGSRDGAEAAQLYVHAKCTGVFRPEEELKGFAKVFLKAGESRRVSIPLDDKAFRYFNVKTNRFEVEDGDYEIRIGASARDIRLRGVLHIEGTAAPLPYEPLKMQCYYQADLKKVSDEEFRALLGHEIPDGKWDGNLDFNDAICQMYYAKSGLARLVYKVFNILLKRAEKKGIPNLNLLFIYNMPFRGIAKMTGGVVTMEMAEGIVTAVNGHLFKGLGRVIGGFLRGTKKRKLAKHME